MTSVPAKKPRAIDKALAIGTLIHEYRIEKILGTGTFGITYLATDTNLSVPVALKEFLPHQYTVRLEDNNIEAIDEKYQKIYKWGLNSFIGEAQVLAKFKHPNIVRVSRYFTANKTAYIVMDYEEGGSLYDYLKVHEGELNETTLMRIFLPILDGLKEIHAKHYLHRDIKPGNIYMRSHGSPMLIDFGAARVALGGTNDEVANVLTPGYAPPEQYKPDANQGPQTDLYALGATIYRTITMQTPVDAESRIRAINAGKPDPLIPAIDLKVEGYSRDFLKSIDAMLNLHFKERPASVIQILQMMPGTHIPEPSTSIFYKHIGLQRKILIAGTSGSGKTTAIKALSDIETINTDKISSISNKPTTVAFDYGWYRDEHGNRIHLYTTPKSTHSRFIQPILEKGAYGLIVLADNSLDDPIAKLRSTLNSFSDFLADHRFAIGITHMDTHKSPTQEEYYRCLLNDAHDWRGVPPIFEINPLDSNDLATLIDALLTVIDPGVEDYEI